MSIKISKASTLLIVSFDYSPERINEVKSIAGYKWIPDKKVWTVSFTEENLQNLKFLFRGEQISVDFEDDEKSSNILKLMDNELKLKGYSFKTRKGSQGQIYNTFQGCTRSTQVLCKKLQV